MRRDRHVVALERLYRNDYYRFVRVALSITRSEETAHEAVQDAFANVIQARHSYRGTGPLEGWVWRAIINSAHSTRRREQRDQLFDPLIDSVEDKSLAFEAAQLREWIAVLPERQRLAIFLRYYADLDYRNIATALSIEVGTVSATLSAAHVALRRLLKEVEQC